MNNVIQYLLAAVIVVAAVAAVVRMIVLAVKGQQTALTACSSCKLKDVCQNPEKNSVKKCADKVAQVKKSQ